MRNMLMVISPLGKMLDNFFEVWHHNLQGGIRNKY